MNQFISLHDDDHTKICCEYPRQCPSCKSMISPVFRYDYHNKTIQHLSLFFSCPNCGKGFVSYYGISNEFEKYGCYSYRKCSLISSYPNFPEQKKFDTCIENLSPSFCEIYNQALTSEIYELYQISGIGYRKSLEFLIKDYCIYKNPDKEVEIKTNFLSKVITEYVNSENIRKLATVSAWLGNDETHYIRKFEDKDITDLKKFIAATVAFITYELTCDEAEELIASK